MGASQAAQDYKGHTAARVGRTLPSASSGQAVSVAFDFDLAFDFGPPPLTLNRRRLST